MVILVALLIVLLLGGAGFAAHALWILAVVALAVWLVGFIVGGAPTGGGRRQWYGRW